MAHETKRRAVVVDGVGTLVADPALLPDLWILDVLPHLPRGDDVVAMAVNPETAQVGPEELDRVPNLRLLAATSVGTDHLDVEEARRRGITVTNAPDYCTDEVADHTTALVLGLLRQTHRLDRSVHLGGWTVGTPRPRSVRGATLGIWGFGAIGRAVAHRAHALGMRVQIHSRGPIGDGFPAYTQVGWDELIGTSDVLSVHVPLSDETRGRLDAEVLRCMRRGSFLVNVSRGGIVDEAALDAALRSGHLAGAAVDVLATEPPVDGHPLSSTPNLVITPHAAWISELSIHAPFRMFAEAVAALPEDR
ncbi:C-terminal binding protein [Rhodococcus koreensis]